MSIRSTTRSISTCFISILVLFFACVSIYAQNTATANKVQSEKPSSSGEVKITFDEKDPSIMYVESNGKRFQVNSTTKTVEQITAQAAQTQASAPTTPTVAKDEPKEDFYAYDSGDEPFVYRLVNVPTPKRVPKGTWNLSFNHRFSQPLQPVSESAPGLFGLDSMSTSSFGISYGITDKLYFNGYRSPLCQKGLCRTVELGLGYHFTDQGKRSPLGISAYASVEGNDNFTEEYTYNLQAMFSRQLGKRVYLFFSPAVHLNSNGQHRFNPRPDDYSPPATTAVENFKLPTNGASFGMGTLVRITPSVSGIFEFTPRTGFKLGHVDPVFDSEFNVIGFNNQSEPEIGYGVQYNIGKHAFALTFSNTQTTTTSRYNSSNLVLSPRHVVIGFNLFRRW